MSPLQPPGRRSPELEIYDTLEILYMAIEAIIVLRRESAVYGILWVISRICSLVVVIHI